MVYLCVFTLFGYCACVYGGGSGGLPRDWYTVSLCSFPPWAPPKLKFLKLFVASKLSTACFGQYLCVFQPIWILGMCAGVGGGLSHGLGTQPTCAALHPHPRHLKHQGVQKFFYMLTAYNDHQSYVKHALGVISAFFGLFGY